MGWCHLNAIVDQWKRDKSKSKTRKPLCGNGGDRLLMKDWWYFTLLREDLNAFIVGGYLINHEGKVVCYMGSLVNTESDLDAKIEGHEFMHRLTIRNPTLPKTKLEYGFPTFIHSAYVSNEPATYNRTTLLSNGSDHLQSDNQQLSQSLTP
ncbi:hypothetical protein PIB30_029121 [Stylosanthes scabra]|uniref:Uncharacterized protein n=1 Tax=Stylosanthes scabra TaxID=79078 RepID=A0ABU6VBB7_9FABA|nr:hypothetical protein [Stylosanthes scabra]